VLTPDARDEFVTCQPHDVGQQQKQQHQTPRSPLTDQTDEDSQQEDRAMTISRDARWVAAAVQGVIAWEWLVSGTNKVLLGTFPQGLGAALNEGIQQNPNGWYVSLLRRLVIAHSVAFGFLVEAAEIGIAVALLMGVAVLIGPVHRRGTPQYRLAVGEMAAATVAVVVCAFLCINFHFFMGDGIIPWFDPARAFDEGLTLDTLMPPLSLLILVINVRVLSDMTGMQWSAALRQAKQRIQLRLGGGQRTLAPAVCDTADNV
jgi:hypothetical protein